MAGQLKRLFDVAYYQLENYPLEKSFSSKVNGKWEGVSTQELVDQANEVSRGLLAMGIKPGDKIGMISNNRYEWHIMDIGILQIGAVNVPIYPTISADDYNYIFNHAELNIVVVSDKDILAKVNQIKAEVPSLKEVFTFNEIKGEKHWSEIKSKHKEIDQSEVQKLMDSVKSSDMASIIYTSGTTGKPKGVMLSHNNILSNVYSAGKRFPAASPGHKSLSFLPICHIMTFTPFH